MLLEADGTPNKGKMGANAAEQTVRLGVRFQVLKHAKGRDDQIEAPTEIEVGDVAPRHPRPIFRQIGGAQFLAADRQHRLGGVDPRDESANFRQRQEPAARAAAEFENAGVRAGDARPIERHVVDGELLRVVVFRGVVADVRGHFRPRSMCRTAQRSAKSRELSWYRCSRIPRMVFPRRIC